MPVTALTNAVRVNSSAGADTEGAATVALASGGFAVIWRVDDGSMVFGRLYGASGVPLSAEFAISGGQAKYPVSAAALTDGGFVVTWGAGSTFQTEIFARRFDGAGLPLGAAFQVNSTTAGEQLTPRVVGLAGGGFVVAWDTLQGDYQDIRGQLYSADGAPVGSEFVLNAVTAGPQGFSAITPLDDGGFVAVWQSAPDGANVELKAQRFTANGTRQGEEFQVNATTANDPIGVDAASLSDGSLAFSWTIGNFNGGQTIYVRRFAENGTPLGGDVVVSVNPQAQIVNTSITALTDGDFVVSWMETVGGVNRLLARGYNEASAPITDMFMVNQSFGEFHGLAIDGAATLADGSVIFSWTDGQAGRTLFRRYAIAESGVDGSAGDDVLHGTAAADIVNALAGADQIFLDQGGDDRVDAGDGNDGLYFGDALTVLDAVDGGLGIDSLAIQGVYAGLTLGSQVTGIEVLLLLTAGDDRFGRTFASPAAYAIATSDANVATAGRLTVQATDLRAGESLVFNGAAETDGQFRIFAGTGTDHLTGGVGADGFLFGAEGNLTGADRVQGGPGTDSIALRGNYVGANAVRFEDGSFGGIEVLTLLSGHTKEFGGLIDVNGFDYDLILADGNVAAGARLDVIATNLRPNESAWVDARAELDGSVRILAGAGDDRLFGGANADILSGGPGADQIDGGGGADLYVYRSAADSAAASRDSIVFSAGDRFDLLVIDADGPAGGNDAFTFIGAAAFGNVAGQLRAYQSGPTQWTIEADVDGDGAADLAIAVTTVDPIGADAFIL